MRVSALVLVAAVLASAPARAQSAKAAAEVAFRKGKQLMDLGEYAEACAAFAESQRLDPRYGTEYNLARCLEQADKLIDAWLAYLEVAAKDAPGPRRDDAARRAKALEAQLTRVLVTVREPAPGETVHVGALDATALVGTAVPVQPGDYRVAVEAPECWSYGAEVHISAGSGTTPITIPPLICHEGPPSPPPSHVAGRGHGRRIAGVVLAGAGVVGVGVGLWFGKQVLDLQGEAEDACGGAGTVVPCSGDATRAQALVDDARGKATIADVAMGAGAALVIGGVILYATAPRDAERPAVSVAPLVGGDRVGVSFAGRF